ncbi:MAG TPA: DUF2267 domain-containing protein [Beijerinckiaceae bacterium]|nr:DUF2267 domain-containing protein [Beijerinckiaceae bacterium]
MEAFLQRIADAAGIDTETARKAVGIIFAFLKKEAPAESEALLNATPGAAELAAEHGGGGGGMMGGLMGMMPGGGIMALGGQLMGAGLSMGQIQTVSKELFAIGRETAGEDAMGAIVGAVPGLSQFV